MEKKTAVNIYLIKNIKGEEKRDRQTKGNRRRERKREADQKETGREADRDRDGGRRTEWGGGGRGEGPYYSTGVAGSKIKTTIKIHNALLSP